MSEKIARPRLTLDYKIVKDLLFANKPAGLPTHAVDKGRWGFAEMLQQDLEAKGDLRKVYVVHRLDKTTTGAMAFALSESKAKELFEAFKNRQVKKRYLFLTQQMSDKTEFPVHSHIEKQGHQCINTIKTQNDHNAETLLKKVKLNALFQLWEALPTTGRSHQIRLHAKQVGLNILGDTLYGGAPYPHLCLHSASIEVPGAPRWDVPPPPFFERMGLIRDSQLGLDLSSFDKRERLFHFLHSPHQALRLMHLESSDYRIDQFGEALWIYWYKEQKPTPADLERFNFISDFTQKKYFIRKMLNRGKDPNTQEDWQSENFPEVWTATENNIQFELRKNQGLSPGLFLDQRENRYWLLQNAKGKKVLNLFAYTCGFSLCAALGEAQEVVSVDLSKTFLEWGKKNFLNNNLNPAEFQFYATDSFKFLEGAKKHNRYFDIIVCDPPSFSRDGKNVFNLEKQLGEVLRNCYARLAKNGVLLFSCNLEKWDTAELRQKIAKELGISISKVKDPPLKAYDFEDPYNQNLMKSYLIHN